MKNSFDVEAVGHEVASVVACIERHDLNSMLIRVSDLVNRAQRRKTLAHLDHTVLYLDAYVHFIQEASISLHAEVLHRTRYPSEQDFWPFPHYWPKVVVGYDDAQHSAPRATPRP